MVRVVIPQTVHAHVSTFCPPPPVQPAPADATHANVPEDNGAQGRHEMVRRVAHRR